MKARVLFASMAVLALVACNAKPEFKEFNAAKCGLTVLMPGEVKEESRSTEASGMTLDFTLYTATVGNSAYLISCNEYPADLMTSANADDVLDSALDGAIGQIGGTVDGKQSITVDGNPGREVSGTAKISGQDAVVKARFILVKNRLLQAMVLGAKGQIDAADMSKFVESVKIAP